MSVGDHAAQAHKKKVNKRQRHQESIVEYKIQMLKKLMQEGVSVGTVHSLFHKNKKIIESALQKQAGGGDPDDEDTPFDQTAHEQAIDEEL